MKHIKETNWRYRNMYVYTRKYPNVVLVRYAITPTGRASKYWATITLYGNNLENMTEKELLNLSDKMVLPKLPKGYAWSEVYIY